MTYVFEVIPDYVGPGSNWPVTKLADFNGIPHGLLQKIRSGCEVCHTRLLSAIWDEHFPDVIGKGALYRAAAKRFNWSLLLDPSDPYHMRVMSRHMRSG